MSDKLTREPMKRPSAAARRRAALVSGRSVHKHSHLLRGGEFELHRPDAPNKARLSLQEHLYNRSELTPNHSGTQPEEIQSD